MTLRRSTLTIAVAATACASAAGLAVATGSGAGPGAAARPAAANGARPGGEFRHALAAKLGERLDKPADDVLAAMREAAARRGARPGGKPATRADRRAQRADRLARRLERLRARVDRLRAGATGGAGGGFAERARTARDAWAAAVAKPLGVSAGQVTAALRALVAERLGSLVRDRWITAGRRDALLACFDDAAQCRGAGRARLGLAFLRAGL